MSVAEELRRAFDLSFAAAPRRAEAAGEQMLAIRAGTEPCAFRIPELAGVAVLKKIVPLPGPARGVVLAAVRGGVVPVYRLATLLGLAPPDAPPLFAALCGRVEPVALGFEALEGLVRVAAADLHAGGRPHAVHSARIGAVVRSIVSVPSIVRAIKEGKHG
jgi:hypothetical protein